MPSRGSAPLFYERVILVTSEYLGPAADRFIARQVHNHLHKQLEDLKPSDLTLLIDWLRIAVALLTEDSAIIERYTIQLRELSKSSPSSASKHQSA